jgi:hypothetical protein
MNVRLKVCDKGRFIKRFFIWTLSTVAAMPQTMKSVQLNTSTKFFNVDQDPSELDINFPLF